MHETAYEYTMSRWLLDSADGSMIQHTVIGRGHGCKLEQMSACLSIWVQKSVCVYEEAGGVHDHLVCLQDAETNWQFDIFGFAEQAQGNALSLLSFHFMKKFAKIDKMGIDVLKLAAFVHVIEKGYDPKNPYHNRLAQRGP